VSEFEEVVQIPSFYVARVNAVNAVEAIVRVQKYSTAVKEPFHFFERKRHAMPELSHITKRFCGVCRLKST